MDILFARLRARRDELLERGTALREATRERSVGALGRVRSGAIDWRRMLQAREARLPADARWFGLASLERRVLHRADRALGLLALRVRGQIRRLRRIELPAKGDEPARVAAEPEAPKSAPKKKRSAAKRTAAPKRFVLPIADYDAKSAREVIAELPRLSDAQRRAVLEFERTHKKRRTILAALNGRD